MYCWGSFAGGNDSNFINVMADEQTDKTATEGKETDKPVENTDKPVSLYDKTEAIVTRQEEANKEANKILDRQEKLHANQRLAGTTGGNVEVKTETPEQKKTNQAQEFFKGTALGDAIKKTNE